MIETIKHLLGFCGEPHGLAHILLTGGSFLSGILHYLRNTIRRQMMRKKKRVPFHIKHNLKPYEYEDKKFYAKNQEEADAYIQRLKEVENKESALT